MILIKAVPMPERTEEIAPADSAQAMENVVRLFDLRLEASREVEKSVTERWPAHKAFIFIFGTSLLIWALIFTLVYYLL